MNGRDADLAQQDPTGRLDDFRRRRLATTLLVVALVLVVVLVDLTLTGWGPAGLPDCMLCTAMVLAGAGMVIRLRGRIAHQTERARAAAFDDLGPVDLDTADLEPASGPAAQVMLRQWCASGMIAGVAGLVAEGAVMRAAVDGHPWSFASLDLTVAGVVFGAGGAWLVGATTRAIRA